jgi:hypothetical protein
MLRAVLKETKMKAIIVFFLALFTLTTHAASFCNADGADPLDCKSADGKTEFYVHPRFLDVLGVSADGFCDGGYLKIDGVEVNGVPDGIAPDRPALQYTSATTSLEGLTVQSPWNDGKNVQVTTAVSTSLTDVGVAKLNNPKFSYIYMLVFKGSQKGMVYLADNGYVKTTIQVNCK